MINTPKRGKTGGSARGRTSAGNTGRGLAEISDRKHLTSREVERLIEATKGRRNEIRDRCLLLLMFRHGLRVSEACGMKLDQVDTKSRVLHVARLKGGLATTQPLRSDELRAISAWLKERARMKPIGKAFLSVSSTSSCTDLPSTCSCKRTAKPLPYPCSLIPTCCATLAASPWPTKVQTRGSFRIISDTGIFSTPSSTRPPTRYGSRSCGDESEISGSVSV